VWVVEFFIFLTYFPYFEKNKRRLVRSPCCLCHPLIFFVFYAVHVISGESKQLVLSRISYSFGFWGLYLSGEEKI
jgi:hypothetical protein